ncbi:thermonuclease family protein [Lichenifustis flavocetrariae]|nr:thermonuclease family protein [Lichenifustis flavocetrariae]
MQTFRQTLFAGSLLLASPVAPQPAAPAWAPVPVSAVYQTGDSWTDHSVTYRLYGVQSCLRGTAFTNTHGQRRDCGEASLAMLVALVRDLRPLCAVAGQSPAASTLFVFCIAQPTAGAGAGSRIDLGTALIATGFAFAAQTPDGQPVHAPYAVAEQVAQKSRAGLWAFADLPDPNAIILRRLGERKASAATAAPTLIPSFPASP